MSRRSDRNGRLRDAERRYEHAAGVANAERQKRRSAEQERDDALMRAEHAEREAARLSELHFGTVGFLTPSEYAQIGKEPHGQG